jgi:hypothetical protein
MLYRIKYPDEMKCIKNVILLEISTAITKKFLAHSSPNLTNKVCTNVDPILCHSGERMLGDNWHLGRLCKQCARHILPDIPFKNDMPSPEPYN